MLRMCAACPRLASRVSRPSAGGRKRNVSIAAIAWSRAPMSSACCQPAVRAPWAGPQLLTSLLAGLLSSSCCLLQLALNLFAVGCAGFNKVLGPVRSQARMMTGAWLFFLWAMTARRNWPKRNAAVSTLLCVVLTFLPELLLASGGASMAPPTDSTRELQLVVDGMGCEACQSHVRTVIERSAGVVGSEVDFTKGTARLLVADGWGFDLERLSRRLEVEGYTVVPPASTKLPSPSPPPPPPPPAPDGFVRVSVSPRGEVKSDL